MRADKYRHSPYVMARRARGRTQAYVVEENRGQTRKTGKLFQEEGKGGCTTLAESLIAKAGRGKREEGGSQCQLS